MKVNKDRKEKENDKKSKKWKNIDYTKTKVATLCQGLILLPIV